MPASGLLALYCRSGASPVLLPSTPVEYKPVATAAASSSAADGSSSSSKSRWQRQRQQQKDQRQQQAELLEQQRRHHLEQQQQQQQHVVEAAASLSAADLRLGQGNQFLPPDCVLQLSEFMLPQDSKSLDFYRWLLS